MAEQKYNPDTIATVFGWVWAEACDQLDAGKDPREAEIPEIWERMQKELRLALGDQS